MIIIYEKIKWLLFPIITFCIMIIFSVLPKKSQICLKILIFKLGHLKEKYIVLY